MSSGELCPHCESYGECLFKVRMNIIVKNIPPNLSGDELIDKIETATNDIERLRKITKKNNPKCPFSDYSPNFGRADIVLQAIKMIFSENSNQAQKPKTDAK